MPYPNPGGGSTGPGDRKLLIPPESPFADVTALEVWALANLDQLRNTFGEDATVTTVVVTDNSGMPDTSSNTYLWAGEDQPPTYSVNQWVVSSGVTPTDLKDLLESLPNTNFVTDRQEAVLQDINTITDRRLAAFSISRGGEPAPARIVGDELFILNKPRFNSTGMSIGNFFDIFESAGSIGLRSFADPSDARIPSYLTPTNAASGKIRRIANTDGTTTEEILAPGTGTLASPFTFTYDNLTIRSVNGISFVADSDITNFRMSITDMNTGDVVKYFPNREVWGTGDGGTDFAAGQFLITFQDSNFYFDSKLYDFSIRYDSGELVESVVVGSPTFSINAQNTKVIESQDSLEQVVITPTAGVDIQGEVNQALILELSALSAENVVVLLPTSPDDGDILKIQQLNDIGTNSLTIKNGPSAQINFQQSDGTILSDNEFVTFKSRELDFIYTSNGWFLYDL